MIVLFGTSDDPILSALTDVLSRIGAPHRLLDQRSLTAVLRPSDGVGPTTVDGAAITAVVLRPVSVADIVAAEGWDPTGPEAVEASAFTARFLAHCETEPWLVVNRLSSQSSNLSKPWQLERIRPFFDIPRTLVTTDPERAAAFVLACGRGIVKSVSAVRSVVHEVVAGRPMDDVAHCPTLFQERIDGTDVRVHVIGDTSHATAMDSSADDYRYDPATARAVFDLPDDVARRCTALSRVLGLALSGIDLRLTPEGRWVCFEVNPSPAFTYFEPWPHSPITDAVAGLLCTASGASVSR
jgi:hypothetical protein